MVLYSYLTEEERCQINGLPDKMILKFILKGKRTRKAKTTLKKNKVRGLTLSYFNTYYITTVIKTVSYSVKEKTNRSVE
jgi:hypothetical protein